MVYGLGNPNNFDNWPVNLRGQEKSQALVSGLYLQTPPKAKYRNGQGFGEIVEGQIVTERDGSKGKKNNSNQQETDHASDSTNRLAYMNAYANSVRESVKGQTTVRANMSNLDQPITQQQLQALNTKLDSIGNKLDQLLGSKEQWNLQRAILIDNSFGNTELGMA